MKVAITDVHRHVVDLLDEVFEDPVPEHIADYLVWAEMSGVTTQGLVKLTGTKALQRLEVDHAPRIERDTPVSRRLDAGGTPSISVTRIAAAAAVEKAAHGGFGAVGFSNAKGSNGALGYYTAPITAADCIAIISTKSPASASAFGGIDPVFGTNPIACSFPTDDGPVTFDMATTAMTMFGLIMARDAGEEVAADVGFDHEGRPTVDPGEIIDGGSLRAFDGGYKGSGLAMTVEMLGGPLVGTEPTGQWGTLVLAISPELFVDVDRFKRDAAALVRRIRDARPADADVGIRIPGDRARQCHAAAERAGVLDVPDELLAEIGFAS